MQATLSFSLICADYGIRIPGGFFFVFGSGEGGRAAQQQSRIGRGGPLLGKCGLCELCGIQSDDGRKQYGSNISQLGAGNQPVGRVGHWLTAGWELG